jgi:hypothetical protein
MMTETPVGSDGTVARYLYSGQNFSSNGVKANAFIDKRNPKRVIGLRHNGFI